MGGIGQKAIFDFFSCIIALNTTKVKYFTINILNITLAKVFPPFLLTLFVILSEISHLKINEERIDWKKKIDFNQKYLLVYFRITQQTILKIKSAIPKLNLKRMWLTSLRLLLKLQIHGSCKRSVILLNRNYIAFNKTVFEWIKVCISNCDLFLFFLN